MRIDLDLAHASGHYPTNDRGRITAGFVPTQGGNPCRVPNCPRFAGDGSICAQCCEEWEVLLANVPAMVEDLELAARKAVHFTDSNGGGRSTEPPEPSNRQAAYYLNALRSELVGQIRLVCAAGRIKVPDLLRDDTVAMSRWLLRQSRRLPYLPPDDGWGLVHDLAQMMADCLATIDRPAQRKYVTGCSCGLAVFAPADKATAKCTCGAEYDVAATYEARMEVAREAWVTIDEASKASGVKLDTIKKWIKRGRIEAQGTPQRVLYGEVLRLADERKMA